MPTGLILPEHHAEDLLRQRRRPKGVDFFAGAGGCSLGAIQAGIEVVAAVEWEPYAVMTYMTNLCR
jgi:DNA (cytosine-5)-methyltransferase 1